MDGRTDGQTDGWMDSWMVCGQETLLPTHKKKKYGAATSTKDFLGKFFFPPYSPYFEPIFLILVHGFLHVAST